jgi:hypothetical protein
MLQLFCGLHLQCCWCCLHPSMLCCSSRAFRSWLQLSSIAGLQLLAVYGQQGRGVCYVITAAFPLLCRNCVEAALFDADCAFAHSTPCGCFLRCFSAPRALLWQHLEHNHCMERRLDEARKAAAAVLPAGKRIPKWHIAAWRWLPAGFGGKWADVVGGDLMCCGGIGSLGSLCMRHKQMLCTWCGFGRLSRRRLRQNFGKLSRAWVSGVCCGSVWLGLVWGLACFLVHCLL